MSSTLTAGSSIWKKLKSSYMAKAMYVTAAITAFPTFATDDVFKKFQARVRNGSKKRQRFCSNDVVQHLSDSDFKFPFRLSRRSFASLVDILLRNLQRDEVQVARSSGGAFQPDSRLAITLRILAGGSYIDQMLSFRIGRSTTYAIFHENVRAIFDEILMPRVPVNEPDALEMLTADFHSSRKPANLLRGCIGALDGIVIAIQKPPDEYVPRTFYCRKGIYALPVKAIVNARYRFVYMTSKCVGSTHDSVAFHVSALARKLGMEACLTGTGLLQIGHTCAATG